MENTIGITTTLQNNATIQVTALQGIDFAIIENVPYGMTYSDTMFRILPHLGNKFTQLQFLNAWMMLEFIHDVHIGGFQKGPPSKKWTAILHKFNSKWI